MDSSDTPSPRAPRKNLFLAASTLSGALSTAVRIRNLSETGALIDAPALPNVGEHLRLNRAEVEIGGTVVWRSGNICGVEFEGRISIDDWIAGKCLSPHVAVGQARVDEIQRLVRAGQTVDEPENPQQITATADTALDKIKEPAATRVRYGYRRIHVLLRREGWDINHHKALLSLSKGGRIDCTARWACSCAVRRPSGR